VQSRDRVLDVLAEPTQRRSYSTGDVARITQASYRQLDYWDRTGLASPSIREAHGSGTQRRYSAEDVARVHMMMILLDAGVSLQRIRRVLEGGGTAELRRACDRVDEIAELVSA